MAERLESSETTPEYNFETIVPKHTRERFWVPYIDEEQFDVVTVAVFEDKYIKPGERPTGVRDLTFTKTLYVNHRGNQGDQGVLLTKLDVEDSFEAKFNSRNPLSPTTD